MLITLRYHGTQLRLITTTNNDAWGLGLCMHLGSFSSKLVSYQLVNLSRLSFAVVPICEVTQVQARTDEARDVEPGLRGFDSKTGLDSQPFLSLPFCCWASMELLGLCSSHDYFAFS